MIIQQQNVPNVASSRHPDRLVCLDSGKKLGLEPFLRQNRGLDPLHPVDHSATKCAKCCLLKTFRSSGHFCDLFRPQTCLDLGQNRALDPFPPVDHSATCAEPPPDHSATKCAKCCLLKTSRSPGHFCDLFRPQTCLDSGKKRGLDPFPPLIIPEHVPNVASSRHPNRLDTFATCSGLRPAWIRAKSPMAWARQPQVLVKNRRL